VRNDATSRIIYYLQLWCRMAAALCTKRLSGNETVTGRKLQENGENYIMRRLIISPLQQI